MLVNTIGTPRSDSARATASPSPTPGSTTAASTAGGSSEPSTCATGSCPRRRTTISIRERTSPLGSATRTRFTTVVLPVGARIESACEYENGMNARARILVVDDDADIRSLLTELLGRAGYDVSVAADGRVALRRLYESPPSLVLLDVSMPELDGYQTLERIRDVSEVPVIMLTARAEELEKVRGLGAGADDYVAKPFGRQELLARVQALLRRSRGASTEVTESYA